MIVEPHEFHPRPDPQSPLSSFKAFHENRVAQKIPMCASDLSPPPLLFGCRALRAASYT